MMKLPYHHHHHDHHHHHNHSKTNYQQRITIKLSQLHELLEGVEQDVMKWRATNQRDKSLTPEELAEEQGWVREVTKALKIYHWYNNFSIKVLCRTLIDYHGWQR